MAYGYEFLPGYEQVYDIFEGDYSWDELRVYRQESSGRLFYATASGCSCFNYEDEVSESDLIELQSLSGAQEAVKGFLGESSSQTYLDAVEALRGLGLR